MGHEAQRSPCIILASAATLWCQHSSAVGHWLGYPSCFARLCLTTPLALQGISYRNVQTSQQTQDLNGRLGGQALVTWCCQHSSLLQAVAGRIFYPAPASLSASGGQRGWTSWLKPWQWRRQGVPWLWHKQYARGLATFLFFR